MSAARTIHGIFALIVCGLITACAGQRNQNTSDYRSSTYMCDEGRLLSAQFDKQEKRAAVLFNGRTHTLTRQKSEQDDSAVIYKDSIHKLIITNGSSLSLERADVPLFRNCENLDTKKT